MKKRYKLACLLLVMMAIMQNAQVTVSGADAASNGSYTTLKAAFDAFNAQTQTGYNIVVQISASTTETATARLVEGAWETQTINLRNQPVYTFNHNPENAPERFKLVFGGSIGNHETESQPVNLWISGKTHYISAPKLAGRTGLLEVFNPAGQRILAKSLVLEDFTAFDMSLKDLYLLGSLLENRY